MHGAQQGNLSSIGTGSLHPQQQMVIEELRTAKHKWQESTHICVCPCLMTPQWMKSLYKASDVVLCFPVGPSPWPNEMHQALLIGIVLSFIPCMSWQLRFSPKRMAMGRTVQSLWKEGDRRPETCSAGTTWLSGTTFQHVRDPGAESATEEWIQR